MKKSEQISDKIYDLTRLERRLLGLRFLKKKIVFTNGVFDVLHKGHIYSLTEAAEYGNFLIVGVNSDESVKRLKGNQRPINQEQDRMLLLASLIVVDAVVLFQEDTPLELIKTLKPDVLVKGGDYKIEEIVGAKEVLSYGGRVEINPILEGFSTTGILKKIEGFNKN